MRWSERTEDDSWSTPSELRPTQRKLHAAWQELQGRQVLATPGVARELAPLAVDVAWMGRPSDAENRLRAGGSRLPKRRGNELRQQAWWGEMWADGKSPYGIVTLTPEQEELAERIRTVIDPACFPNTDPEDIPGLGDAAIVSESMALGAKLLLTSDLRSIDHIEVNRWTVENGTEWGIPAEETLHDADLTFLDWTKTPAELERWIQAGLLACWPSANNAPGRRGAGQHRRGHWQNDTRRRGQVAPRRPAAAQRAAEAPRPGRPGRADPTAAAESYGRERPPASDVPAPTERDRPRPTPTGRQRTVPLRKQATSFSRAPRHVAQPGGAGPVTATTAGSDARWRGGS